jgi:hypothetical protein
MAGWRDPCSCNPSFLHLLSSTCADYHHRGLQASEADLHVQLVESTERFQDGCPRSLSRGAVPSLSPASSTGLISAVRLLYDFDLHFEITRQRPNASAFFNSLVGGTLPQELPGRFAHSAHRHE